MVRVWAVAAHSDGIVRPGGAAVLRSDDADQLAVNNWIGESRRVINLTGGKEDVRIYRVNHNGVVVKPLAADIIWHARLAGAVCTLCQGGPGGAAVA